MQPFSWQFGETAADDNSSMGISVEGELGATVSVPCGEVGVASRQQTRKKIEVM